MTNVTLTPYLTTHDCAAAIDFYERAEACFTAR